jgi:hypothetical protein
MRVELSEVSIMLPFELLRQSAGAFYLSRCLQVVAEAGVADFLDDEPATASSLASPTGLDAKALARVLNFLTAHGIFARRDCKFVHTPASRLLRTDDPRSMRSFVRLFGLPMMWTAAQNLDKVVKTGASNPDEIWSYLAQNPPAAKVFNQAMTEKARSQVPQIVASYDFSSFRSIADIGGGYGHLIRAILAVSPASHGILFDLPRVVDGVSDGQPDRLSFRGGDFFQDELPRCDAYVLMEVIHDWPDEEALAILRAVRRSATDGARLLLIEALMPSEPGPNWTKTLDIAMLNLFGGGRQRAEDEYCSLLRDAGFRLERTINVHDDCAILDAVAV